MKSLQQNSYLKNIGKKLILATTSLVISLIFVEVVLRLFFPQPLFEALLPVVYVADELVEYRLKPMVNSRFGYNTNRLGMRDFDRYTAEKPENTYRILFLGDSYIFSMTKLEDSIPKVLEKMLEGKKTNIEVLNAGVFGYGTINEYLYLKHYGLQLEPDLVLVGFYLNDCGDNLNFPDKTAVGGRQISLSSIKDQSRQEVLLKVKVMEYLYTSHLVRLLKNIQQYYINNNQNDLEKMFQAKLHSPKEECIVDHGGYGFNHHPLRVGKCWDITIEYLNKLHELADEYEVELGVVLIPDAIQMDTPSAQSLRKFYEEQDKQVNYEWDNPQKNLMELAQKNGWKMFNPLPELRRKTKGSYLHYCKDPHLNELGNESFAREVADWLLHNQLSGGE